MSTNVEVKSQFQRYIDVKYMLLFRVFLGTSGL